MGTVWFCLVALMIALYVVFDGFDLGAGIIHLRVAKTEPERRLVLRTIGPVWDGNEVWLLAAGGTLYFAFPVLYASSFSGFYLPLMIVLWLLILRGISIEFRSHIATPVWIQFWDVVFSFASMLLVVFFGAALGNVVRGVPLDSTGYFFVPLWTNFALDPNPGVLDWYTLLVGMAAFAALALHGALWVAMKTEGPVHERSHRLGTRAWWGVAASTVVITAVTFYVQPQVPANLAERPWGYIFPAIALLGLLGIRHFLARNRHVPAFLGSCQYLLGMLASVVFGLYPYVLPATNPAYSLTVENAKTADYGLKVGLVWWVIGMILVTGYFVYVYRHFRGKTKLESEGY